jgi:hypothetical protein
VNKKENEGQSDKDVPLVRGIPDDVMDKLELVAGDDEKAIRAAQRGHKQAAYIVRTACGTRAELQELFLKGVVPALLRLALVEKDSAAKQWAGMMLASIGCSIEKYDKELCKTNAAYLSEKKKIIKERQLIRVLFPKPIMEATRRELRKARDARRTLFRLKKVCGSDRTWRQSAKRQGLHDYLPFVELAEFSVESKSDWFKRLWPLIKKNNPDLLPKLRARSDRSERVDPSDKKSGTRKIKPRWATFRPDFRNALGTLARLRGTLQA